MPERISLTTPIAPPTRATYTLKRLSLEPLDERVYIELVGNDGKTLEHTYTGTEATVLMVVLNKANLSTNSLHKRLFTKLIADGVLAGAISGSPD